MMKRTLGVALGSSLIVVAATQLSAQTTWQPAAAGDRSFSGLTVLLTPVPASVSKLFTTHATLRRTGRSWSRQAVHVH